MRRLHEVRASSFLARVIFVISFWRTRRAGMPPLSTILTKSDILSSAAPHANNTATGGGGAAPPRHTQIDAARMKMYKALLRTPDMWYVTLRYITLNKFNITLHYVTLYYIILNYITWHCSILHYITLHYITLHYITLMLYKALLRTPGMKYVDVGCHVACHVWR